MEVFPPMTTSLAPTGAITTTGWSSRVWALLITLCIVLFLDGLDVSMIGVALPSIGAELDLSTSSGLLFGGLMTGVGWRWTFLLPVPIALGALAAAYLLLPKDEPAHEGGHDLFGAAFSTSAMLLLVYTVVSAPEAGWTSARTLLS